MKKFAAVLFAFAATAAFSSSAIAQDDTGITLRVDTGSIMASTGGEYQTANTGKPLVVGERLMIAEGSSATAIYDGGCEVEFNNPGTYEVPSECKRGAYLTSGSAGTSAAIIAGAAVVGAVLLDQADDEDVGPLSTGVRHL